MIDFKKWIIHELMSIKDFGEILYVLKHYAVLNDVTFVFCSSTAQFAEHIATHFGHEIWWSQCNFITTCTESVHCKCISFDKPVKQKIKEM